MSEESHPEEPTLPEVHVKLTSILEDFSPVAAAEAANGDAQPLLLSSGMVANPFLLPQALPVKSRQAHLFTDKNGNHKKFGSALGLLTARFVQMILVSRV